MTGINHRFIEDVTVAEKKQEVWAIQYQGFSIWPFFRVYFWDHYVSQKTEKNSRQVKFNPRLLLKYLGSLVYSIFYLFVFLCNGKRKLVLSGSERLKSYQGRRYERVAGEYADSANFILNADFNTKKIKGFSHSTFYILMGMVGRYFLGDKGFFQSEIAGKVACELGLTVDVSALRRLFLIKYYAAQFMLWVHRPEQLIVVNAASFYPFIVAAKKKHIPVIEIQHGVINDCHPNYNFKSGTPSSKHCFPDTFFSWGKYFDQKLSGSVFYQVVSIKPYYYFFLSLIQSSRKANDKKVSTYQKNEKIILLSGQVETEALIREAAYHLVKQTPYKIVYCPRHFDPTVVADLSAMGVVMDPSMDFYDWLTICDVHISVFSTTILESIALGIPTILYCVLPEAREYFGDLVDHKILFDLDNAEAITQHLTDIAGRVPQANPVIQIDLLA